MKSRASIKSSVHATGINQATCVQVTCPIYPKYWLHLDRPFLEAFYTRAMLPRSVYF